MYPEDDARGEGGGAADGAAFAHLFAKLFTYKPATFKRKYDVHAISCLFFEVFLNTNKA